MQKERNHEAFTELTEEDVIEGFKNAQGWCTENLSKFEEVPDTFDPSKFNYTIDNEMVGADVMIDPDRVNGFKVSLKKLNFIKKREEHFKTDVGVDIESIFVYIFTFTALDPMGTKFVNPILGTSVKKEARFMENINRVQRGLKPYIED